MIFWGNLYENFRKFGNFLKISEIFKIFENFRIFEIFGKFLQTLIGPHLCNRSSDLLKTSTNRENSPRYARIWTYLDEIYRLVLVVSKSELRLQRYGPAMVF